MAEQSADEESELLFKGRLMALISKWKEKSRKALEKPDDLAASLRSAAADARETATSLVEINSGANRREVAAVLEDRLKALEGKIESAQSNYQRLYQQRAQLGDLYKAASTADYKQRMRKFGFQMASAVGIATIILVTSYVAHRLGIPLPMMRPIGM